MQNTPTNSKRHNFRTALMETLERREMLNADWQNPGQPIDVNADMYIAPVDILAIVNDLNREGARELGPRDPALANGYIDVSGDGFVAPNDVLRVVNQLNSARPIVTLRLTDDTGFDRVTSNDRLTNASELSLRASSGAIQRGSNWQ